MPVYTSPVINDLDDFLFGVSPNPVRLKNGLIIGGGQVYPELNFTLPAMEVNAASCPKCKRSIRK
jgi:methanol---5-hydroxybenzimidazolylcobamide Co-methyltransferase